MKACQATTRAGGSDIRRAKKRVAGAATFSKRSPFDGRLDLLPPGLSDTRQWPIAPLAKRSNLDSTKQDLRHGPQPDPTTPGRRQTRSQKSHTLGGNWGRTARLLLFSTEAVRVRPDLILGARIRSLRSIVLEATLHCAFCELLYRQSSRQSGIQRLEDETIGNGPETINRRSTIGYTSLGAQSEVLQSCLDRREHNRKGVQVANDSVGRQARAIGAWHFTEQRGSKNAIGETALPKPPTSKETHRRPS